MRVYCLKTLNKLPIYPLGNTPSAPSESSSQSYTRSRVSRAPRSSSDRHINAKARAPLRVRADHCTSRYGLFVDSYRPGPVGLRYSPREVCTSVARGTLTKPLLNQTELDTVRTDGHQGWPLVGFPWSKPLTQTTIGSLFGMVPARLEPLTGLLGLVRYLGVVSWSIGKAGGRSRDGLRSHRVKDIPVTYI